MNRLVYFRERRWTPLEVAIWFLALVVLIISGVLLATTGSGSWVLLIGSGLVVLVSLMGCRADAEQMKQNADDHGE
jgi:hypothetical protein